MSDADRNEETVDPLTVGELKPLKDLAEELSLNYDSLRKYAQKGRLKAMKFGRQWASTHEAVRRYLVSRYAREKQDENAS